MEEIKNLLVKEVRRRLVGEGLPRIKKCLGELTQEEIWHRPNENSNSVGNLVLHLCGNVQQWIVSGLGGRPDVRDRAVEFSTEGGIPAKELIQKMEAVMQEVNEVLNELPAKKLTQPLEIQGFEETGLSVLVHVVEHFSYHVGQVTYFVKYLKNIDTAYYGSIRLNDFGAGEDK